MIRCAICDDDLKITGQLESLMLGLEPVYDQKCDITVFFSGEEFCDYLNKSKEVFDIVLMDIEMREITGIDAGRRLREDIANNQTHLVFVSSHNSYFADIVDLNVFRFIPKPVFREEFNLKLGDAIKSVLHRQQSPMPPDLAISISGTEFRVPIGTIMYLESDRRQIHLHTATKTHTYYGKLSEEESKLPPTIFCRIHRSFLISFSHITHITSQSVTISDNNKLPISVKYSDLVKKAYSSYREMEMNYGNI